MADDFPLLSTFIEVKANRAKREIASLRADVKALARDLRALPTTLNIKGGLSKEFGAAAKNLNALNRELSSAKRNTDAVAASTRRLGFQGARGGVPLAASLGISNDPTFRAAQLSAIRGRIQPVSQPQLPFGIVRSQAIDAFPRATIRPEQLGGGGRGGGRGGLTNFRGISFPAVLGGFAAAGAIQDTARLTAQIEKTTFALGELTDSQGELESLFNSLKNLAVDTTTDFTQLLPAAQRLLGSGFDANQITPLLSRLADLSIITQANGVSFDRLVGVVARNNLQFKLLTRDIREFTNAGLNILPSLQRQLGAVDFEEVFDRVKNGEVTINNLLQAIRDLTSEGGIAFNLQAKAANTAFLAFDKLREEVNLLKVDIGTGLKDEFAELARSAANFIRTLRGETRRGATGEVETARQRALREQAQGRSVLEGGAETALGFITTNQLRLLRLREKQLEALRSLSLGGLNVGSFFGDGFGLLSPLGVGPGVGSIFGAGGGRDAGFEQVRRDRLQLAADFRRRAGFADTDIERQNLLAQAEAFEDDARIAAEKITAGLEEVRAAIEVLDPVGAAEARRERERAERNERRERLAFLSEEILRLTDRSAAGLTPFDQTIVDDLLQRRRAEFDRLGGGADPVTRRTANAAAAAARAAADAAKETDFAFNSLKDASLAATESIRTLGETLRQELADPTLGGRIQAPIFEFLTRAGRVDTSRRPRTVQPIDILESGEERRLRQEAVEQDASALNKLAVEGAGFAVGVGSRALINQIAKFVSSGAGDLGQAASELSKAGKELQNADTVNIVVDQQPVTKTP